MAIILCFSGCKRKNEQNQTIDDKIAIEIKFLDKEISKFIDIVTGNMETRYEIEEEKTSIKSTDENNNESNSSSENSQESSGKNSQDSSSEKSQDGSDELSKQSEGDSEPSQEGQNKQSSSNKKGEEITIMSMQYSGDNSVKDEDWEKIKIEIENLYTSWAVVENDISTKENINQEEIKKIDKNFDNLFMISIEKNKINFMKETVDFYNNIIDIAEKVNYDKNKLYILKVKKKLYEVYYNVEEKDWNGECNCTEEEKCNDNCECVNNNEQEEKIKKLEDALLRNQAELINFKRRKEEETSRLLKYAEEDIIVGFLPILDNIERAINMDDDNLEDEVSKFLEGFKMIYVQIKNLLEKFEVKEIVCLNKEFDPTYHQAILTDKVEGVNSGIVIEVLQKGYTYKDKVIRPSMVKVSE